MPKSVAGFMLPNEQKILEEMKTPYNKYFAPLAWSTSVVTRARKENRIKDDFAVKTLIDVNLIFTDRFIQIIIDLKFVALIICCKTDFVHI